MAGAGKGQGASREGGRSLSLTGGLPCSRSVSTDTPWSRDPRGAQGREVPAGGCRWVCGRTPFAPAGDERGMRTTCVWNKGVRCQGTLCCCYFSLPDAPCSRPRRSILGPGTATPLNCVGRTRTRCHRCGSVRRSCGTRGRSEGKGRPTVTVWARLRMGWLERPSVRG